MTGNCSRCGRPVMREYQLCRDRTPASPFCSPSVAGADESLEIEPGLNLRPGSAVAAPLLDYEDPYAEAMARTPRHA